MCLNTSCTEREWNNPYDNIPPDIWAPVNLNVEVNSVNSITLTWADKGNGEEGYKIDRKTNDENWQLDFIINTADSYQITDNSVNLEGNYYAYRIYAYAGNNFSSSIDTMVGIPPMVTTDTVSNISYNSARCGGHVTASGSTMVSARGICWSSSQNPTINNSHTTDGSGTGEFTSTLTGLDPITKYYVRAYSTNSFSTSYGEEVTFTTDVPPCGVSFTIAHKAGDVSPLDQEITYSTLETNLTGSNKCWIVQNLGATGQASSALDTSTASAGWYWQFNKKQGFFINGNSRTPNTGWISSINEGSDWSSGNDPCALLLNNGWRMPTLTEWQNVLGNGSWFQVNDAYNSALKLHAAGYIVYNDGSLKGRGSDGNFWSTSQDDNLNGWWLYINNFACVMGSNFKSYGRSVRCIK